MRKRFQLSLIMIVAAAVFLGGLFWFVRDTGAMMPPANPAPLEAVVVLTGGSNRLEAGFRLLKEGAGQKLFVSGVYRGVEVKELLRLMREESDEKADCCIDLGAAQNTVENARETAAWLKQQGYKSLYLVTANYHMRRALLELENAAPDLKVTPYPVVPQKLDMNGWWQDGGGLVLREYCKYLWVLFRPFFTEKT